MELKLRKGIEAFKHDIIFSKILNLNETSSLEDINRKFIIIIDENIYEPELFLEKYFIDFKNNYFPGIYSIGVEETNEEKVRYLNNEKYRRSIFLKLILECLPHINSINGQKSLIKSHKILIKTDSFFLLKKLNEINSEEYIPFKWILLAEDIELRSKDQEDLYKFIVNNDFIDFDSNDDIRISWKGKVYLEEKK